MDLAFLHGMIGNVSLHGACTDVRQQLNLGPLQVVLLGKPAPAIYEGAMEMLKVQDPKQVLAIGDSMEHDIAGQQPFVPD